MELTLPRIAFTSHLRTVGPTAPVAYAGATVGELISAAAVEHPRLADYVLDDQGRVRKHIAIFVDGEMVARETALQRAVGPQSEVYVMQALSGG